MTDQYHQFRGQRPMLHEAQGPANVPKPKRICADCGYKDFSTIPPPKCPRCHNQPKNALNEQALESRPMNRAERRKQAAERRAMERKVNKQVARENPSGKYEAS